MFKRVLLAFLALPGLAAFLAPLAIAALDPWRGRARPPGLLLVAAGFGVLLWCVRDFYAAGKGTLAPWSPPEHLVRVGLYRFVRNPMYIGVLVLVAGWAIFFMSPLVGGYSLLLAAAFHARVVHYEEPRLAELFGREWDAYSQNTPRWLPF